MERFKTNENILSQDDLVQIKKITLNIDSVSEEMIKASINDLKALAQRNHKLNKFWRDKNGKINGYLICEDGNLYGQEKGKTVHLKYFGTNREITENPFKLINSFIEEVKNSHYDKAVMLGWNKRLNKVLERFGFEKKQKENIPGLPADYYELDLAEKKLSKEEKKVVAIENFKEKQLQQILKDIDEHFEKNIAKKDVEEMRISMENLSEEIIKKISQNEKPLTLTKIQKAILNLKIARYLQTHKAEDLDINTFVDALIQTPKFLNKESGKIESLFKIHREKERQIIAKMRKISQIKTSFHSLLETEVGKVHPNIVDLFKEYSENDLEKKLEIFKKLKEFFKDNNASQEDKKATFLKIELDYGIEIIPKLDLYENLFETPSGNYHLSVLRTKNHLKKESEQMNHCVGTSDSYINKMNRGEIEILSFRDKNGDPIITIEYNLKTGDIEQMKKENDKYLNFDDPCYEEFIWALDKMQTASIFEYNEDSGELTRVGKRKIRKVNTSELGNLDVKNDFLATGRGTISTSDFDKENDFILKTGEFTEETSDEKLTEIINKKEWANYKVEEIAKRPEDITEETRYLVGNIDKSSVELLNNRKNPLHIGGNADFKGCTSLTSLPEGISFGEDADFWGCTSLTSLPEGISFGGDANFRVCTSLTSLPEGISFGGDAYFWGCTSLTSLPEGISFGGGADFEGCTSLTSIGEGISFGGDAYFEGCTSLTSIGEGISFGGNVNFKFCTSLTSKDIERLKKMKAEGEIPGELYL